MLYNCSLTSEEYRFGFNLNPVVNTGSEERPFSPPIKFENLKTKIYGLAHEIDAEKKPHLKGKKENIHLRKNIQVQHLTLQTAVNYREKRLTHCGLKRKMRVGQMTSAE